MIQVLGFSLYGPLAASHRYRLAQYVPGLARHGIDVKLVSLLDDTYLKQRFAGEPISRIRLLHAYMKRYAQMVRMGAFDMAIVYGELLPFVPYALETGLLHRPFIYDMDDAFYLKYRQAPKMVKNILGEKWQTVFSRANAITAGNAHLAKHVGTYNHHTCIMPTVVDTKVYMPTFIASGRLQNERIFTVGWMGSPSTAIYLGAIIGPLEQLGQEGPVRLIVVGGPAPRIRGVEVLQRAWTQTEEVSILNQFDVGIMPLPNDEWARGKCAFKLIQYMACGVPVVASSVGANIDVVAPDCGFLAPDATAWLDSLRRLRDEPALRQRMGDAARERVVQHYSLERTLPRWAELIHEVAACAA